MREIKLKRLLRESPSVGGCKITPYTLCLVWSKCKLKPVSKEGVGGHLRSLLAGRFMSHSGSWRTELMGICQNYLWEELFLSII